MIRNFNCLKNEELLLLFNFEIIKGMTKSTESTDSFIWLDI